MTGGKCRIDCLYKEGVRVIFGLPGVQMYHAIIPILDYPDMKFITTRHEQATTYMADGYAKASGKVGVAMVVPGPGLQNASAGITNAYDHHMVVVTNSSPADVHKYWYVQYGGVGNSSYNESWSGCQMTNGQKDNGTTGQSQGGGYIWPNSQNQSKDIPSGAYYHDSSAGCAQGIMHLYNFASTTYYKRWYCIWKSFSAYDHRQEGVAWQSGQCQTTTAIDKFRLKWADHHTGNEDTGISNMDIVVQLYGI